MKVTELLESRGSDAIKLAKYLADGNVAKKYVADFEKVGAELLAGGFQINDEVGGMRLERGRAKIAFPGYKYLQGRYVSIWYEHPKLGLPPRTNPHVTELAKNGIEYYIQPLKAEAEKLVGMAK